MQQEVLNKVDYFLKNTFSYKDISIFNIEEEGVVVEVNSAIILVKGFTNIAYEECVIIKNKFKGIVSLIKEDLIKVTLLEKTNEISIGDKVKRTFSSLKIPVGENLIGRVIDALGNPLDGKNKAVTNEEYFIERPAANIIDRKSVTEPLQTGIKIIDSLIPIGRGQRELILGDRQTGKTSIAINTIINQKNSNVICIYCSIGQRDNSVANLIKQLEDNDAMKYTIVIQASGNELAGHQFIAPYSATSIAEYFMQQGKHALVVYDDLSKHAKAYRELSLLLEKNPGREAYPSDIFYIHSRLLERSTKMKDELGGGSITSLPIIETEAENIAAYIPTNVISITDGQIYLSPNLFQKGILPAVDANKSVSRVGSAAQLKAYKQSVKILGIEFSQFEELESFSKFSTTLDEATEKVINKGKRIRELFKQNLHDIQEDYEQTAIFLCLNNGIFDKVKLENIQQAEKFILDILHTKFMFIKDIVKSNKKLDEETITEFISEIKNKASEQKWKV